MIKSFFFGFVKTGAAVLAIIIVALTLALKGCVQTLNSMPDSSSAPEGQTR